MKNLVSQISESSYAKKNIDEGHKQLFKDFTKNFYSENRSDDLSDCSSEELANEAVLSFKSFLKKKKGEIKIVVADASVKSRHLIIDIINDDAPFLVDSTVAYFEKNGIIIRNIIHPTYSIARDAKGELQEIVSDAASKAGVVRESVIQLHLDKSLSAAEVQLIVKNLYDILSNVALVVKDWKSMSELAVSASKQIANVKKLGKKDEEISEIQEFVSWMNNGNFIFFGAQEFDVSKNKKGEFELVNVADTALGVFASESADFKPEVQNISFEEVSDSVANPYVIEILKSRYRSRIHRNTSAERIRIQKISTDGKVVGEFRFIGLFTSAAYHERTTSIPLIRNKIAQVIAESGYRKGSHNYKDLISILESYPRDELFQISTADLLKNAIGIVTICGRSQVRFFARNDKFNRFVSCLVYTPRDRSNSELRTKVKDYLADVYGGEIADSFVQITESNLTRFHVIVRTKNPIKPKANEQEIEAEIAKMTRVWGDDLIGAIKEKFDNHASLAAKYRNAFSVSYMNRFEPTQAACDIEFIENCLKSDSALFNLYESASNDAKNFVNFKVYNTENEIPLSVIMPILDSFGVDVIQEQIYVVNLVEEGGTRTNKAVWIHHFYLRLSKNISAPIKFSAEIKTNFEEAIALVWSNVMACGLFNRLAIVPGLNWKQIYIMRSYVKYMVQAGFRYSQDYIANVMSKQSALAGMLSELFEVKFDPALQLSIVERQAKIEKISNKIKADLNKVDDVGSDTVIRGFLDVINATLRTNAFQLSVDGAFKGYMSFKFDCKKIPFLPLPLPHAEIFVHSPRVEAVHLRGGKVARGGLRWSDRHEDFRTEVLGLVKAQMTKNAVIVPVGSKGGFVVKTNIAGMSRDEFQKEGIECYKTFLRGLLDITDNVVNGKVEHPQNVVRYDEADPYLVVAADKGTATFSDIANSISAEYNFWLGDAFASGGSVGYDHKKMGITAKGGWISVMRHFREMGVDTQSEDFTCVGIGDLSGDVFGNGMLLSKHIKLVAAFNHLHIFLDPSPDAAKSFVERQRMFNLPRSSWTDYDQSLISKGGGIFERSAKSIKISPEIKQVLAIEEDELEPNALMQAILKAPVDLLWNGGIGTYVKSVEESHQEVGDRANDALRINGNELRCKVIGEGGNLGFTQKGRIEYALTGGRINTDAMDNSAGVDCSDHEVNIKIALTSALRSKKMTLEERNKMLEAMTDEVSHLVLEDNRLQTQAISVAYSQGVSALGDQGKSLDRLEETGLLNRKIEFLPSRKDIEKRQISKIGMTRPELCVMLAYAKMDIYNNLLTSDILRDKYFERELLTYFPRLMQQKLPDEILSHQLRNEIIATQITNFVVNRLGVTFVSQLSQDSGFSIAEVVKNIIIACDSFGLREVWEEIEKLDGAVAHHIQMQMFLSANKLIERSVTWLLRNPSKGDIKTIIMRFRKIADEFVVILSDVLAQASKESFDRKIERYRLNNVEEKLAAKIASLDPIASVFDIAEISAASNFNIKAIAKVYFVIGTRFSLKWLRSRVSAMSFDNHWHKLSAKIIQEDLYTYQMKIAKAVVDSSSNDKKLCEVETLEKWMKNHEFLVDRFDNFVAELKMQSNPDLSAFVIALNRLKPLV
jgi:glutamate dehydrogenase